MCQSQLIASHLYQHVFCIRKRNLILTWFLSWWWNIRSIFSHQKMHTTLNVKPNKHRIDPNICCSSKPHLRFSEFRCSLGLNVKKKSEILWCENVSWDTPQNGSQPKHKKNTEFERDVANRLKFAESPCIYVWLSRDKNCSNLIEMWIVSVSEVRCELLILPYRKVCDMNIVYIHHHHRIRLHVALGVLKNMLLEWMKPKW